MKWVLQGAIAALLALSAVGEAPAVPDSLHFQDLYFREITLQKRASSPACVLFFYSNSCPVARRYLPRMIQLEAQYRDRGVRFYAVNVSPADTLYDVADFAQEYGLTFPVVKDRDFSVVKALGITRTPEVVVLDKSFSMAYQGRIDDQYRLGGVQAKATRSELADALAALLGGSPVPTPCAPAEGCVVTLPEALDPTLENEVEARNILANRCLSCHVDGGAAPFSLNSLEELRARKDALYRAVADGQMPPRQHYRGKTMAEFDPMSGEERAILLRWLAGALNGDGALMDGSPSTAGFNRTFQAKGGAVASGPDSREWVLEPAVDAEMWVAAFLVQGMGQAACVYYEVPGGAGKRCYLAGGLLPGQPLRWNGDEGMLLPAGAILHLSTRGNASGTPALHLRTLDRAPATLLTCRVEEGVVDRSSKIPAVLVQRLEGESLVRDIAIDFGGLGACVSVFLDVDARESSPVFTLPVLDPRWVQPVAVEGRADQVRAEVSFPGYLNTSEVGPGDAKPIENAMESVVSVYTHSASPELGQRSCSENRYE